VGAPVLTAIILPCPCFWLKGRHWFRIWLSSKVHPLDYEFLSTSQWLTSFFFLLLAKLWRRKSKFSQLSCTCWHIRDLNSMNLNSLTLIFICFTEGKYNSNCNWIQASRRKWRQAFPGAALSLSLSHTHTHTYPCISIIWLVAIEIQASQLAPGEVTSGINRRPSTFTEGGSVEIPEFLKKKGRSRYPRA
jgi:hypothetical protein